MRNLNDFSTREWLQLLPLQLVFKQTCNDLWLKCYKWLRPENLDTFLKGLQHLNNHNIAMVIAFEQPWALDWLLKMAKQNLDNTTVLVFDNLRRLSVRQEISQVCRKYATPYLALPINRTRHVNRSHGMAMTWIFHNVVRAIRPRLFAYIDHDMIPVQKIELSEMIGDQPFGGWKRSVSGVCWNLWAGYCLYNFSTVAELKLNFLYDFSAGLDTGGGNWSRLYQNYDPNNLCFAESRIIEISDPVTGEPFSVQVIDDCWFHIGAISYKDKFRNKLQACKNLAQALESGISWQQICDGIMNRKVPYS